MVAGSKESSGVAIHLLALTENNLVCGILLNVATHGCRIIVLLGMHCVIILVCDLANGLAVVARRPDILAGADMTGLWWDQLG